MNGTYGALETNDRQLLPPDVDGLCYCGNERDLSVCEFQCEMCLRHYHESCLSCYKGGFILFMTNYQFFCRRCSLQETLVKKPATFSQLCLTAIANLMYEFPSRKFFSKDSEVIPFIEANWELMTTEPRRMKNNWHLTVSKTMLRDSYIFLAAEDSINGQMFGLVDKDLSKVGPNHGSLLRLMYTRPHESKSAAPEIIKTRVPKRKTNEDSQLVGSKRKKVELASAARLSVINTSSIEYPFNRYGYRYRLAEPDPHALEWQTFDNNPEWAGKPIPGFLYRTVLEKNVLLSLNDKAPQLKVNNNRLTVLGEKGYSMIRATDGISHGSWYYEVVIDEMPGDSASRIGWCQKLGDLQAPCGYDKFGYSWRSRKGTVFHHSNGKSYCFGGYKQGDVLGFYIKLPLNNFYSQPTLPSYKDKPLVKFKSHFYFEEKDNVKDAESKLKIVRESSLMMFLNGICQGIAFEDLYAGTYYPAISLYKNAKVTVNFGPHFKHPPEGFQYRPLSEVTDDTAVRHALSDILYHIEHDLKQQE